MERTTQETIESSHGADAGGLHRADRFITAARRTRLAVSVRQGDSRSNRRVAPRVREETALPSRESEPTALSSLIDDYPMDPWSRAYIHLAETISASLPLTGEAILAVLTPGGTPPYATIMLTAASVADKLACDILLIDGNYGESRLARRIGITAQRGLGEVLAGTADWTRIIVKTNVPRLWLLPASDFRRADRCADSRWARAFLNALRNRYRLILFTAGKPRHPGVRCFLPYCAGAYVVVRLGLTTDRLAKKTVRQAEDSGCRILGCVVTHD